jgi:hypothetical protein
MIGSDLLLFRSPIDMVQPCDTLQARSDSDFGVKYSTVQFYAIEHNFKSNRWIELKLYQMIPDIFVYLGVKVQVNRSSEMTCNSCQKKVVRILLFTSF